ncbi:hypothetical protein [Candidatus Contubernalis alkaliaceticus]|uniref:hypothetical protein n=1 Tax=Candidatus Contubernalis alkaliaceticus TaxID=338645 RepID=UPI001F4C49F0|nr:hypothetical protein [Candidatus Contubernalis alkalaceticus]UNC91641.1 hypothetical protein HUE98_05775 [Candidatus Contubernalis alkalaceticus]
MNNNVNISLLKEFVNPKDWKPYERFNFSLCLLLLIIAGLVITPKIAFLIYSFITQTEVQQLHPLFLIIPAFFEITLCSIFCFLLRIKYLEINGHTIYKHSSTGSNVLEE